MPIIHVQLLEGRSDEQKACLLSALTKATQQCLGVEAARIQVQISELVVGNWSKGGVVLPAQKVDPGHEH